MCSKRPVTLPELQEEDEVDSIIDRQSQFQVQIIVTPTQGCEGGAEIRVMGGTPRYTGRKLPPIHTYENTKQQTLESPSNQNLNNFDPKVGHGLINFKNPKCDNYHNLGKKYNFRK